MASSAARTERLTTPTTCSRRIHTAETVHPGIGGSVMQVDITAASATTTPESQRYRRFSNPNHQTQNLQPRRQPTNGCGEGHLSRLRAPAISRRVPLALPKEMCATIHG